MPSARPQLPARQWKPSFQMLKQRMCLEKQRQVGLPQYGYVTLFNLGNDDIIWYNLILIGRLAMKFYGDTKFFRYSHWKWSFYYKRMVYCGSHWNDEIEQMPQVVMDIPMPGHPHQSAEVLRANIAPWHANETQLPWRSYSGEAFYHVLPNWNVEQLKFSGNIDHAFEGRFNLFRLWKCMDPQKDCKSRVHFTMKCWVHFSMSSHEEKLQSLVDSHDVIWSLARLFQ